MGTKRAGGLLRFLVVAGIAIFAVTLINAVDAYVRGPRQGAAIAALIGLSGLVGWEAVLFLRRWGAVTAFLASSAFLVTSGAGTTRPMWLGVLVLVLSVGSFAYWPRLVWRASGEARTSTPTA